MSIRTIAYDFRTFAMFSIFKSVILFYSFRNIAILGYFWCNSRRNHANRKSKNIQRLVNTLVRSRMKIQEASEDSTEGEIMFPVHKTSYMETNTQMTEKWRIRARKAHSCHTHRAWSTRLGYGLKCTLMCLGQEVCSPSIE